MEFREIVNERIMGIVMQHPEGITAAELCETLIQRGWAYPDLSPEGLGLDDDAIIRLKR